jgi:hypothetical protein
LKSIKALHLPGDAINNENLIEDNYPNVRELTMIVYEHLEDPLSL